VTKNLKHMRSLSILCIVTHYDQDTRGQAGLVVLVHFQNRSRRWKAISSYIYL
jgi:hypothetical protein